MGNESLNQCIVCQLKGIELHLMYFLSIKNVQVFKTTLINLNYKKNNDIEFLNNVKGKIGILLINFKKRDSFWCISK